MYIQRASILKIVTLSFFELLRLRNISLHICEIFRKNLFDTGEMFFRTYKKGSQHAMSKPVCHVQPFRFFWFFVWHMKWLWFLRYTFTWLFPKHIFTNLPLLSSRRPINLYVVSERIHKSPFTIVLTHKTQHQSLLRRALSSIFSPLLSPLSIFTIQVYVPWFKSSLKKRNLPQIVIHVSHVASAERHLIHWQRNSIK